jgi:hypothetical protein
MACRRSTSRSFPSLARSARVTGRCSGGDQRRLLALFQLDKLGQLGDQPGDFLSPLFCNRLSYPSVYVSFRLGPRRFP